MTFTVFLTAGAEADLEEIYRYIARTDSRSRADKLLDKLEALCDRLVERPERGHVPPELERVGIHEFRERTFKPYRIIYRIMEPHVYVHCILDGRRDMEDLLVRRLMR